MKTGTSKRTGFWFILPAMTFAFAFFLLPLVAVLLMSMTDFPLLGDVTYVGLQNYTDMMSDTEFHQTIIQTLIYTVLVTPPLFFVGLGAALLIQIGRAHV